MTDRYSRRINYLRASLTDRCNLRCRYCMPGKNCTALDDREMLTLDEIYRIISISVSCGIEKVRFTGGEPLLRKDVFPFFRAVSQLSGVRTMSLTTNGTLIQHYENEIRKCAFSRINVSLDTLDRNEYAHITRTDGSMFDSVYQSLDILLSTGAEVKVNCVPLKGVNDSSVTELAKIAMDRQIDVRFIEFMPMGDEKEAVGTGSDEIMRTLEKEFGKASPEIRICGEAAMYFRFEGFKGRIGVISPLSHKFCNECTRLRLTPDGILRPCLFHDSGINIRSIIRNGGTDADIAEALREAVMIKPGGHSWCAAENTKSKRNMNMIGG